MSFMFCLELIEMTKYGNEHFRTKVGTKERLAESKHNHNSVTRALLSNTNGAKMDGKKRLILK